MGVRHKGSTGEHREIKMEQQFRNSPSSGPWVKFEDSDEVLEERRIETKNLQCSPSSRDVRDEHRDILLTGSNQNFGISSFKRNSFPNKSRYSASDCLRFGLDKNRQMGWSRQLMGEGED